MIVDSSRLVCSSCACFYFHLSFFACVCVRGPGLSGLQNVIISCRECQFKRFLQDSVGLSFHTCLETARFITSRCDARRIVYDRLFFLQVSLTTVVDSSRPRFETTMLTVRKTQYHALSFCSFRGWFGCVVHVVLFC